MNRRYLVLAALVVIMILIGSVAAKTVWSICDEAANPGCADYAKSQGYWNFQYDDAAPYTTAGLYCCWWERWYKWQKFSQWKGENTLNLGSEDNTGAGLSAAGSSAASAQVETESFCPSCCATCDDDAPGELEARSAAIMAKKPWLTEGKNKEQPSAVPTATVAPVETQPQMVMSFSDPE